MDIDRECRAAMKQRIEAWRNQDVLAPDVLVDALCHVIAGHVGDDSPQCYEGRVEDRRRAQYAYRTIHGLLKYIPGTDHESLGDAQYALFHLSQMLKGE